MLRRDGAAGGLRTGLLLLVVLGVVGTALTLAYERHWGTTWQLAPWITLGIVSVALVALVVRQTTVTVRLARAVAILAVVSASLGVWQHIDTNLDADAAADHRSDDRETTDGDGHDSDDDETTDGDGHDSDDGTSLADVVTGSVGQAPVPAALAIAPVGLALGLATIGLGRARRPSQE